MFGWLLLLGLLLVLACLGLFRAGVVGESRRDVGGLKSADDTGDGYDSDDGDDGGDDGDGGDGGDD